MSGKRKWSVKNENEPVALGLCLDRTRRGCASDCVRANRLLCPERACFRPGHKRRGLGIRTVRANLRRPCIAAGRGPTVRPRVRAGISERYPASSLGSAMSRCPSCGSKPSFSAAQTFPLRAAPIFCKPPIGRRSRRMRPLCPACWPLTWDCRGSVP